MKSSVQYQIEQGYKAWQKSLDSFRQENALLKYRLSEMVDNNEGSNFLQLAEYFQNELLLIDDTLKKLFIKIDNFSERFGTYKKDEELPEIMTRDYNKLKNDFLRFEGRFLSVKEDFNKKMLENIKH